MNSSFYSSSIKDLVDQSPETTLGHLAKQNSFPLETLQRNTWLAQLRAGSLRRGHEICIYFLLASEPTIC